jgi:hypothetical protein
VLVLAACVAIVLLASLAVDVVKLRRVKRGATPLGVASVRRAAIGTSATVVTPTAIGYLHPAVVLPVGFRAQVDAGEWDAVVAHECAHLARLDDWAKAVQTAVVRAGWWIPGLWLLSRALDLERELASDEQAALATGSRAYAACLLRLATGRGAALAPAFGSRRAHVAIRVERLLRPSCASAPVVRATALGIATAAALAAAAVAILSVPGSRAATPIPAPQHVFAFARGPHAVRHAAPQPRRIASHHATVALAAPPPGRLEAHEIARAADAPAGVPVVPAEPVPAPRVARRPAAPHRVATAQAPVQVAFVAPPRRCTACIGEMRSPDVAAPAESRAPRGAVSAAAAAASSAVAVDDSASGPVTLNPQVLWARMPIRALMSP